MNSFSRGLRDEALDALWAMTKSPDSNWWKDLLAFWSPSGVWTLDRQLRLALRNNSLNLYLKGQSVARVNFGRYSKPFVEVHVKYAFDNANEKGYAKLFGTMFLHGKSDRSDIYAGCTTLRDWMVRAATWETPEKAQVERVVADNHNVIDLEMGIPGHAGQDYQRRIDLVALEPDARGARIVFWEAKRISDSRLRSRSPRPEVMTQIDDYRRYLDNSEHQMAVMTAYRKTCKTLGIFREMAAYGGGETLYIDPLVLNAGEADSLITVDQEPRLAIFGSKDDFLLNPWPEHEAKLLGLGVSLLRLPPDDYHLSVPPVSNGSIT